jgi:hypothetical protein
VGRNLDVTESGEWAEIWKKMVMAVYVLIQIMAFIYCSNILRCCMNCTASIASSAAEIYPALSVGNDLGEKEIKEPGHCPELILGHLTMLFQLQLSVV